MISQEKLLTVKGRTEPLLEEIRDIVLYQRMQVAIGPIPMGDGCRCGTSKGSKPDGKPIAFTGKWVGWQTDPTREDGGNPRPYGIKEFPVDGSTLDPQLQQLLVLTLAYPGCNCFLFIFVCGKAVGRGGPLHLSPIPVASLLPSFDISAQLLLKFLQRTNLECQTLLHCLASHLQRVGQIV